MVFRFPKNKDKSFNLHIEKQKLDIISKYVDIKIPEYTIIDSTCIMYPIVPGVTLDVLNIDYTDNLIQDIVSFLKQLHAIPLKEFDFLNIDKKRLEQDNK
jgi:hypothetical protein